LLAALLIGCCPKSIPMTILHVVEPFASGIAVFVKSLTETMPDDVHIIVHGERKHEIAASEVKKIFPQKNIRFIRWRSAQRAVHPLKDFLALSELYKIIRRLKKKNLVDAVHLHSSKSGLLGRVACRMAGVENVVYTPNGAPFLSGKSRLANYFYQQLEKFGHGMGGKVVCCSESEMEAYKKIGVQGEYVNNGIQIQPPLEQFKEAKGKFRIVTSGRIVAQKNPQLFNAIASYFQEFEAFEFIWAGDGEDRAVLKANNITVTGWLHNEQVKELVAQSHIYLSTSLYEGLSFGVLEAMALKMPMLLSNCVGNSDVIKNGLNGNLYKNEMEAIIKILHYYNNREMLQVMGDFSHQICKTEFNAQSNFSTYRTIYSGGESSQNYLPLSL
jgi:glycosyltransferase involved in cell wall biosynthesis